MYVIDLYCYISFVVLYIYINDINISTYIYCITMDGFDGSSEEGFSFFSSCFSGVLV